VHERLRRQPSTLRQREATALDRGQHVAVALGDVTTATLAWFFAAARTIEGPPTSICSMHSSGDAPDITVSVKG
jgi:hypothetical protein